MGIKFRKRITIAPGFKINISRRGISTTIGPKGFSVNAGKKGVYLNTGIPGTGIYDRKRLDRPSARKNRRSVKAESNYSAPKSSSVLAWIGMFLLCLWIAMGYLMFTNAYGAGRKLLAVVVFAAPFMLYWLWRKQRAGK